MYDLDLSHFDLDLKVKLVTRVRVSLCVGN